MVHGESQGALVRSLGAALDPGGLRNPRLHGHAVKIIRIHPKVRSTGAWGLLILTSPIWLMALGITMIAATALTVIQALRRKPYAGWHG